MSDYMCMEKDDKRSNNTVVYMYIAWIFVCRHDLFGETNSFLRAQENCDLFKQIMSKDILYLSMFLGQMKGTLMCLLSFKHFLRHAQFWKLGNIVWPSSSWNIIIKVVLHLDQSCVHKNIWWVIGKDINKKVWYMYFNNLSIKIKMMQTRSYLDLIQSKLS